MLNSIPVKRPTLPCLTLSRNGQEVHEFLTHCHLAGHLKRWCWKMSWCSTFFWRSKWKTKTPRNFTPKDLTNLTHSRDSRITVFFLHVSSVFLFVQRKEWWISVFNSEVRLFTNMGHIRTYLTYLIFGVPRPIALISFCRLYTYSFLHFHSFPAKMPTVL